MIRDDLKGGSTTSNKSALRHKEAVSVQAGKKLYMDAACGKTLEKYSPSLFLSAANFNEERAEAVHPRGPERRLE